MNKDQEKLLEEATRRALKELNHKEFDTIQKFQKLINKYSKEVENENTDSRVL